ncbi:hypothetical protein [Klebsiella phage MY01]|nr:hypothetical protein [Pseudomonas phage MY01]
MAFDLNFGGYQTSQLPLFDSGYNPTQSSVLGTNLSTPITGGAPVAGGMGSTFASWLPSEDTMRTLFGGTNPETGFQSSGIVSPLAQGLGALFQGWTGMQQLGLARDQLNFQKNAFNTNLRNQSQAYNTALEDRIRGRTSNYEGKEQDVQNYLNQNRLNF